MEFLIKRTSNWLEDKKPCEEATAKEFVFIDRRTVRTLEEARLPENKHWSDDFFASGTNHREEDGMVTRDSDPEKKWVVKFNSLEELVKFIDKYDGVILDSTDEYKGIEHTIEIYDDYRE